MQYNECNNSHFGYIADMVDTTSHTVDTVDTIESFSLPRGFLSLQISRFARFNDCTWGSAYLLGTNARVGERMCVGVGGNVCGGGGWVVGIAEERERRRDKSLDLDPRQRRAETPADQHRFPATVLWPTLTSLFLRGVAS